jgi:hypothetical protein
MVDASGTEEFGAGVAARDAGFEPTISGGGRRFASAASEADVR